MSFNGYANTYPNSNVNNNYKSICLYGGMVDTVDSKSIASNSMLVQIRLEVLIENYQ